MISDELLQTAKRTVDIFSGITGRRLFLKEGKFFKTDGVNIYVSHEKEEHFYLLLEHEISHILFRSDIARKGEFVSSYTEALMTKSAEDGTKVDREIIVMILEQIIGLLEDRRVSSLWGTIYPGSHSRYKKAIKEMVKGRPHNPHDSIFTLAFHVDVGIPVPDGPLDRFVPLLEKALQMVELKGFDSTILVAQWLVRVMLKQIESESELQKQADGSSISRLIAMAKSNLDKQNLQDYYLKDAPVIRKGKSPVPVLGDIDSQLKASEKEMKRELSKIKDKIGKGYSETDVGEEALIRIEEGNPTGRKSPLGGEDSDLARSLRKEFERLRLDRSTALDYTGNEVDIPSYIEMVASGATIPVFKTETNMAKFRIMILIDMSGSMEGAKEKAAERACNILQEALDFKNVDLTIWGFNSPKQGTVGVYRILDRNNRWKAPKASGNTPLHMVAQVAIKRLSGESGSRHLICITDGLPQFRRSNGGVMGRGALMDGMLRAVKEAGRRRIHVSGLMIQDPSENNSAAMTRMFGPKGWDILRSKHLTEDLVSYVAGSFRSFLISK